jgi:chromosome segregation ATPase
LQQISAITRKRLAVKAVERLQNSQAALSEIKSSVSTLEEHTSDYDELLEIGQRESVRLEGEVAKAERDNEQLGSRVSELENTITTFEIKVHELNRKV